jgi:hypothetical protein
MKHRDCGFSIKNNNLCPIPSITFDEEYATVKLNKVHTSQTSAVTYYGQLQICRPCYNKTNNSVVQRQVKK